MFKNYFLSCLRHLKGHKAFTAINIFGLSIGMSAAVVIFMFVYYELGYDRGIKDRGRVYRVVLDARFAGMDGHSASIPGAAALSIPREISGIEQTIPVFYYPFDGTPKITVSAGAGEQERIVKKQKGIIFTDNAYTDALQLKWLAGSPAKALSVPYQVVLTGSRARQYFPGLLPAEVIGRRITYNKDFSATVSGVVSDPGLQFSMTADEFVSFSTATETSIGEQFMLKKWDDWMAYPQLYVKLAKGKSKEAVQQSLRNLVKKQNPVTGAGTGSYTLTLQPLGDVHFNWIYSGWGSRIADSKTLTGLMFIGAFLLLLGSINFINLNTADAARRAKEIGVRKTLGSSKKQLIGLFLGETLFLTTLAATLSLVFVPLLLAVFAGFLPQGLHFAPWHQPGLWAFMACLILAVTLLSGLYPAFILSGFKPVSVLKNQVATGKESRHSWVRKGLTVTQFVIAQFFLIATLTVAKQLQYGLQMDMGFKKTALLNFSLPMAGNDSARLKQQALMHLLNAIPEINSIASGGIPPAGTGVSITNISYAPKKELNAQVQLRMGGPAYLDVYGLRLAAGRNVLPSDTAKEFLVNENYARLLGFFHPEQAIGQLLDFNGRRYPIVGVMKDFYASDARFDVWPMVFTEGGGDLMHIRLRENADKNSNWKTGIEKMAQAFRSVYPEEDFDYKFYDQQLAAMYSRDEQLGSLLNWAAGLTVLISCLGLLGLVIYTTRTRRKEISIRKVLGASVANIVRILSSGFLRLITLAFIIAAPLAWWACHAWLQQFALRTAFSWWIFALGGGGLLFAGILTLSLQTLRAARANPVKSLKTE